MKSFSYKSLRLAFSGISYLKFDKKKNEGGERYCLFFFLGVCTSILIGVSKFAVADESWIIISLNILGLTNYFFSLYFSENYPYPVEFIFLNYSQWTLVKR